MKDSPVVLSVDPGMNMGYCLSRLNVLDIEIIEYGLLKPTDGGCSGKRIAEIKKLMYDKLYCSCDEMVIENVNVVFGSSAFKNEYSYLLQWSYAELITLAYERNLPLTQYHPTTIKKQFTGNGRAKKPEIVALIEEQLSVKVNHNVADAIAIAVTHYRKAYYPECRLVSL